ncbi:hypothetical protein LMG3441_01321 [Achromobacter kerstersii]|uniref:Uncharacterized protein n=1 Tax=Achromobacter kerstersii TaxID=1353890 RepID=A0A6S6ZHI1_9BURK|nr:hypothetical protein LMG3441_01321 [Achromobacter kerstersii]
MWTVKWFAGPWSIEIPALTRLLAYASLIEDNLPAFKQSSRRVCSNDMRALCNKVSPRL